MISGFTFAYNALSGGYPIREAIEAVRPYVDEIVAVDMQSTDGTRELLEAMCDRVVSSAWDGPHRLKEAFKQHNHCRHDQIIMFEADEVYDDNLLSEVVWAIEKGYFDIGVYRLQLEQNFQRCRWYPIPVHRIFVKGHGSYLQHPTNCPVGIHVLPPSAGYLWDCANCFRDNWQQRRRQQADIWGEQPVIAVREHFLHDVRSVNEGEFLQDELWTWTETPFNLPEILRPLVGRVRYG